MKNKAVFLDRDGVINVEKNYVHKIEDFEFMDGIFELLHYFQEQGYLLIVITNQAGIGRGYYTEEQFHILNDWMVERFKEKGIHITHVYYCPYHPEYGVGDYKQDSFERKPNPGMIVRAEKEHGIDLSRSILIGDRKSDIQAGTQAGVKINILLPVKLQRNINVRKVLEIING
ncbi:D-alpha,beta-D-heptose 1,7-bisphosphate phosphatase [Aneurinibacillus soli]|uniref:D,D-heptose 1,7-bisphosphate phosphatase n=1 Tax=Aneurinibacillus soli TaxID=1500254 RepID=A0A0U5B6B2_9BACL|nr:HAD family hydrolase [Aneurinibacillus soli]PYE61537.1 D-alpha,beta-D-heptose 1,7-bisphosphate phosphatase [Aneurinibacillus soli]BAU26508.1 D-glycero-alpha-D-manno-heptose-1,7-bisphosphate 7-phosphatase [Aneurinibacillus soli]